MTVRGEIAKPVVRPRAEPLRRTRAVRRRFEGRARWLVATVDRLRLDSQSRTIAAEES